MEIPLAEMKERKKEEIKSVIEIEAAQEPPQHRY